MNTTRNLQIVPPWRDYSLLATRQKPIARSQYLISCPALAGYLASIFLPIANYRLLTFVFCLLSFVFLPLLWRGLGVRCFAQKYTISGYIKDAESGEMLIGANVYVQELAKGTTTNQYGFYSLTLEKGSYQIQVSFLSYYKYEETLTLNNDIKLNISLTPMTFTQKEVVVTGEKEDKNVQSTQMGTVRLPVEKIKVLPAFMGEVDILKTIQLLPGIKAGGEGSTVFFVRGGGPDQNLILLDEAIVYNPAHLLGFFSVFNPDAIKNVEVIKGGMPANYGGRVSSVLDVTMNEGNNRSYHLDGGLGLISSRITAQGPIIKDTSSFIVCARRTYFDLIAAALSRKGSVLKESRNYFYDLNVKLNYRLSDKDRLFLSGYFGRDVFEYYSKESEYNFKIPWGNATVTARWNHLFNSKLFMNTSLIFSDYTFSFQGEERQLLFKLSSGITDFNVKCDFNYLPNIRNNIKFGAHYIFHTFLPNDVIAKSGETEFDTGEAIKLYANEGALYINDDFDVTDKLKISAGIRFSIFQHIGPFTRYIKNQFDVITDSIIYDPWENIAVYSNFEPRLSLRYTLGSNASVKASYTENYQYLHLISMTSGTLPTDLWMPCTDIIKPQFARQGAIGYFRNFKNFKNNIFESSVEIYYKTMDNLIEYKDGYSMHDDVKDNPDNNITFGEGESYGVEFYLKKRTGKFTGWLSYTLSYTNRLFPALNYGKPFPAKHDRRHDGSITLTYQLNQRWTFSALWVYTTGDAITLPLAWYMIEGQIINEYGERNSFRMPPYHRLDLSATYYFKKKKRWESNLNFSVFNAYNRYNPYFIYFEQTGDPQEGNFEVKAKQVSLFPILPSVTWNFRF